MPDKVLPGPLHHEVSIREAVCIHTKKIYDSCKDKDCIEDLRLYPTVESQRYIETAVNVRARAAKLLFVNIDVEEVSFNKGYYTVDIRYYYKITGEAFSMGCAPVAISGLAVFDKRVLLFGSEGSAKIFTSGTSVCTMDTCVPEHANFPTAVVEAVDPIILGMRFADCCEKRCDFGLVEIPPCIANYFGGELSFDNCANRLYVTLGQFSIIRLERDTQLLMPSYDYCVPEKECVGGSEDDACTLFSKIHFPVDEFFPPSTLDAPEGYCEVR